MAAVLRNSGFALWSSGRLRPTGRASHLFRDHHAVAVLAGLLLLVLPAAGQLKLGDLSSDLNGTVSAGYNADYGNLIDSSHSLSVGGTGTLSGFYYNPNFVSFTVTPFLNQDRDNSSYQSISNASGVNFNSSIFGGSHFPGSISYAKAYNSEGNYAIPGIANYTTHGDSDAFAVSWAELVPGLPSIAANFQMGSNQYSIYGSNDSGTTDNRSLTLQSAYRLKGFNLSGYFSDGSSNAEIPQVLQNSSQTETSTSGNHGFGFAVGHSLPFDGAFSGSFNRSDNSSNFDGYNYSGTIDTYNATASFQPTAKLHTSISTDYSDNLTGLIYQAIVNGGGAITPTDQGQGSHAFDLVGSASYSIMANMQALASADHREQSFLGKSYSADSFGGGITYGRPLFGGNLNTALTLTDNIVSTSSANILGFNGTINFTRRFENWAFGGSFNYSQNVQTLLVTYMSSAYGYSANIRRRFGRLSWSAGAGAGKTGLSAQPGTSSSTESFNTSLGYSPWMTLTGSYTKSNGTGIETGAGIAPTPVPQPILSPNDLILYGGNSYSFSLSSNPKRRLTVAASFAKAVSNTNLIGIASENHTEMINTILQYQFRKMYLTGGYSRLVQGFSASGTPPENVSSFYIGVSRWFNFF